MRIVRKFKNLDKSEFILYLAFFAFSWILMWKTFRLDSEGNMRIASKVWSDFAATIPLIRSFSFGSNFLPQYPLFAGPPIRYHFIFFALVGLLEKIGTPLDWALNSLSALGFFLLLLSIYLLGKIVFKSRGVGVLATILFLFNGSLGFLEFFKKNPLSIDTPAQILNNRAFTSFGPYDGKVVSAFWSLNIFTNQRHLALAYASFLFLIIAFYIFSQRPKLLTWKKVFLIGITIGIFPFIHMAVFGMLGIALLTFFLVYSKLRIKIFAIGVLAIILAAPQYLYIGASEVRVPFFRFGYLVEGKTLDTFFKYWLMNLGLTAVLSPIGFFLADKSQRKLFLVFLALFAAGNIFQFTPETAANHKFFNLFVIGANSFTVLLLTKLWKKKTLGKVICIPLTLTLTLTGLIDLFPIFNDSLLTIRDSPNNPTISFVLKDTPKDSIFLNSSFLYDPASLAGRKIYLGWPYFSWSAGYDTDTRHKQMKKLLNPPDKVEVCEELAKQKIDYVETKKPTPLENVEVNYTFFENNFQRIYFDSKENLTIYEVKASCRNEIH